MRSLLYVPIQNYRLIVLSLSQNIRGNTRLLALSRRADTAAAAAARDIQMKRYGREV